MEAKSKFNKIKINAIVCSEEGAVFLAKFWREEVTPEMKASLHSRLTNLRDAVRWVHDRDLSGLGKWGYLIANARSFATGVVEEALRLKCVPLDADLAELTDFAESCVFEFVLTPEYLAWAFASMHLLEALDDPIVRGNPTTVALLEKALIESQMATSSLSEADLFRHIKQEAAQSAISARAARNASRRTLEAREWARKEWVNRTDIAMTKKQFGKDYALLVQHKFPKMELIKPSTIK